MFHSRNAPWAQTEVAPAVAACPAVLLAGGQGTRLHELTLNECKPAVRFGHGACLVDFSLSNACHSGIRHVVAATQYCSGHLHRHLARVWRPVFERAGGSIALRHGPSVTGHAAGYAGTAAAVAENIAWLDAHAPSNVLILAADHVYRMDYAALLETHRDSGADLTVAAAAVPRREAGAFGIIETGAGHTIAGFLEKPADPPPMPGQRDQSLASMGVYVFRWAALRRALLADRDAAGSRHDFGFDIIPGFVARGQAVVHLLGNPVPGEAPYWRDVGTLDSYRATHLDLLAPASVLRRTETRWPTVPAAENARIWSGAGRDARKGWRHSFVPAPAAVGRGARIRDSVLAQGAQVGAGARLRGCILGAGVRIAPGTVIGEDPEEDARWFRRDAGGTILVTAAMLERRRENRPVTR